MRLFGRQRQSSAPVPVEISEKQGVRYLHLGGDAVQSAMRMRDPFALELEYTRAMFAALLFVPEVRAIGLIGLGGGSIAKYVHRRLPECRIEAVDIHAEVIAAARTWFMLPDNDERLDVREADGARWIESRPAAFDLLLVDGYDGRRIVEALASPGFYAACIAALRPGGCAVFNLWGSDRLFEIYRQRIEAAFGHAPLLLPAEKKGNIQVFAFRPPWPGLELDVLEDRAGAWQQRLGLEFTRFLARLVALNPVAAGAFELAPGEA